jgi:hypothetical protein
VVGGAQVSHAADAGGIGLVGRDILHVASAIGEEDDGHGEVVAVDEADIVVRLVVGAT